MPLHLEAFGKFLLEQSLAWCEMSERNILLEARRDDARGAQRAALQYCRCLHGSPSRICAECNGPGALGKFFSNIVNKELIISGRGGNIRVREAGGRSLGACYGTAHSHQGS